MSEQVFKIEGFHCSACVKLATMKLQKIEGVTSVSVNEQGQAKIEGNREISLQELNSVVQPLGYTIDEIK